jgi:hypothetical protein
VLFAQLRKLILIREGLGKIWKNLEESSKKHLTRLDRMRPPGIRLRFFYLSSKKRLTTELNAGIIHSMKNKESK